MISTVYETKNDNIRVIALLVHREDIGYRMFGCSQ